MTFKIIFHWRILITIWFNKDARSIYQSWRKQLEPLSDFPNYEYPDVCFTNPMYSLCSGVDVVMIPHIHGLMKSTVASVRFPTAKIRIQAT